MTSGSTRVVVITGAGGMGAAIARRLGSGATILLADFDEGALDREADLLTATGFDVVRHVVDVSQEQAVASLVAAAVAHGPVTAVVHTAGLSPVQAPVDAIMRVDVLGTA